MVKVNRGILKTETVTCFDCNKQIPDGEEVLYNFPGEPEAYICGDCLSNPKNTLKLAQKLRDIQLNEKLKITLAMKDYRDALAAAFEPADYSGQVGFCGMGEKRPNLLNDPYVASKLITEIAKRYNIQIKDISAAIGVTLPTIRRWERGISSPSNNSLARIQENIRKLT